MLLWFIARQVAVKNSPNSAENSMCSTAYSCSCTISYAKSFGIFPPTVVCRLKAKGCQARQNLICSLHRKSDDWSPAKVELQIALFCLIGPMHCNALQMMYLHDKYQSSSSYKTASKLVSNLIASIESYLQCHCHFGRIGKSGNELWYGVIHLVSTQAGGG